MKILEIYVDRTLSWKRSIEITIHKLSVACYAATSVKPFMSHENM
jgi:hypothetical protein